MPIVADAAVAVRGDLSKLPGDLKKAEPMAKSLGSKFREALSPKNILQGVGAGIGLGLTNAIGSAAGNITSFVTDAIGAASDLNETIGKTGQIIGQDALPELEKWAEGAAVAFGQSKTQALDAAGSFAIFGKSAGLSGQDLVDFSTHLTELSSDFASFFNTSPEDAITAIGAALRGESEPIRRYGVLLNDATLKERAFKLGLIETTTQALTPQQRVLAAQAEILAQTSDAQGDFARTSGGLANQQRILEASLQNVSAEVGQKLLPIMVELIHFVNESLIPALDGLIGAFDAVGKGFGNIGVVFDEQGHIIEGGVANITNQFDELAATAGVDLMEVVRWIKRYRDETGAGLAEAYNAAKDYFDGARALGIQFGRDVAGDLARGADGIDSAARVMTVPVSDALRKARIAAAKEAKAIPGDIAKALISGQEDVDSGMTQLTDLMENSLSDAAKIAKLKGVLASKELAAGLVDERADVRAAAKQVQDDALEQLQLLESGAYDAAVDSGTTLAEQLRLQREKVATATKEMVRGAKDNLEFSDEAYAAARATMQAWIDGIRSLLGTAQSLASTLPASLRPPGTGPMPTFATGAWDIPSDMLAGLHAGEMVIPADLAAAIRAGVGGKQAAPTVEAPRTVNLYYTGNKDRGEVEDILVELQRAGRLPLI